MKRLYHKEYSSEYKKFNKILKEETMKNTEKITDAELEIMKVLWEKKSLTLNELVEELSKEEPKNKNTIKTLLYRLIDKNIVKSVEKNKKENEYKPLISEKKYLKSANETFLDKVYDGNVNNMLLNFVEDKKITKEEIEKLLNIIDERE